METLAALEPSPFPVISLYLSLTADQHGRETYDQFVRKVFNERGKALRQDTPERGSFDKDTERIREYLNQERDPACQGLAIFACSGAELFEAITLETPFDDHWMFVGSVPHLYPLAKLVDTYPRYAAVVLDTNKARIIVYSLAATQRVESISNDKTRRTQQGGWSQARYQRRADNAHMHHMKEVVETLDRIVREENINQIVIASNEVALTKLRDQLPSHLSEKIVDTITVQPGSQGGSLLESTFMAIRDKDAESDVEKVQELFDEWQGSGLGVTGPEATLRAFELGQVEELIITGSVDTLKPVQKLPEGAATEMRAETSAPTGAVDEARLKLSAELIKRAEQTAARIRFIEDATLLEDVGGVGALLRFRI
jgi:peptide subunit release factor 1 (eRF1)